MEREKREQLYVLLIANHLNGRPEFLNRLRERCVVVIAADFDEARQMLETLTFDLLFAESIAPENGWGRVIQNTSTKYPLTAVAISKSRETEYAQRCLAMGFTAHLVRPIKSRELESLLDTAARRKNHYFIQRHATPIAEDHCSVDPSAESICAEPALLP